MVTITEPQLSVEPPSKAIGSRTTIPFASRSKTTSWQTAVGGSLSSTVTVNVQVFVLSASSVAVTVTVVDPTSNEEPDVISTVELAPQLSSGSGIV